MIKKRSPPRRRRERDGDTTTTTTTTGDGAGELLGLQWRCCGEKSLGLGSHIFVFFEMLISVTDDWHFVSQPRAISVSNLITAGKPGYGPPNIGEKNATLMES